MSEIKTKMSKMSNAPNSKIKGVTVLNWDLPLALTLDYEYKAKIIPNRPYFPFGEWPSKGYGIYPVLILNELDNRQLASYAKYIGANLVYKKLSIYYNNNYMILPSRVLSINEYTFCIT
uniref:Uncharacterized protein n=1 Tax=viral metagenome TaxID=1070528 RepID=A0A6C0CLV6_9ZZZZ